MDFMQSRREERMKAYISGAELDVRTYNLIMGATVVYGLVMNVLACIFLTDFALGIHPIGCLVGYIALCLAGTLISARSDNPVISFLGYNLIVLPVGLVVSISVYYYGGLSSPVVYQAFVLTACIAVIMTVLSGIFPDFFAKLGGMLLASLFAIIIGSALCMFLGWSTYYLSIFAAAIFSLYIGYDMYRAQRYPKTADNAVDCAVDIYLDIINLFLRLLRILGRRRN